jgi:hypothetical protein
MGCSKRAKYNVNAFTAAGIQIRLRPLYQASREEVAARLNQLHKVPGVFRLLCHEVS